MLQRRHSATGTLPERRITEQPPQEITDNYSIVLRLYFSSTVGVSPVLLSATKAWHGRKLTSIAACAWSADHLTG